MTCRPLHYRSPARTPRDLPVNGPKFPAHESFRKSESTAAIAAAAASPGGRTAKAAFGAVTVEWMPTIDRRLKGRSRRDRPTDPWQAA
jgi:hypothetical protein